jgi:predicted dehydrogenase
MRHLNVAVIGCGLIGKRRAKEANQHQQTGLTSVVDIDYGRRTELAAKYSCHDSEDWKLVVEEDSINAVVVSTPNALTVEIAQAALAAGKHVLVEKPPGRDLRETRQLVEASKKSKGILKIGFNHRYHPAICRAHEIYTKGTIGEIINLRIRYGHGGRPGYEKEWRGNAELAGGGELTDQGVHVADLLNWFMGTPNEAFAWLQTAVWPITPLEDNAFGLFRYSSGAIASIHTSWTQWKNLFSFEVFGELGSLTIDGLGGNYGVERVITAIRNPKGGIPNINEEQFEGEDASWKHEWTDFVNATTEGHRYWGTPDDGLAAMTMVDALYRSAKVGNAVRLAEPSS